jgi:hypothetical protein
MARLVEAEFVVQAEVFDPSKHPRGQGGQFGSGGGGGASRSAGAKKSGGRVIAYGDEPDREFSTKNYRGTRGNAEQLTKDINSEIDEHHQARNALISQNKRSLQPEIARLTAKIDQLKSEQRELIDGLNKPVSGSSGVGGYLKSNVKPRRAPARPAAAPRIDDQGRMR